jgi:hypothetical protein
MSLTRKFASRPAAHPEAEWRQRLLSQPRPGWLVVAFASVLRTLSPSGLHQLIPIYPSLGAALAPAPRP